MEIYISTFCKEVTEPINMGGLAKGLSTQLQKMFQLDVKNVWEIVCCEFKDYKAPIFIMYSCYNFIKIPMLGFANIFSFLDSAISVYKLSNHPFQTKLGN